MGENPRVWFVTGCSSGFGRALVDAIVMGGDRVVATARRVEDLEEVAARAPDSVVVLPLDVTSAVAVQGAVEEAIRVWGGVDVVVNNAGRGLLGAVEECDEGEVAACLEVNFLGPLRVVRAFLPHFRSRKSGHFVQLGAAAAISNYAGFGVYGASKAAITSVCESLQQELRPLGVKVTVVEPGPFRTSFLGRSMARAKASIAEYAGTAGRFGQYLARVDGKQPGDPMRAAEAIVRLVQSGEAPLRFVLGRYAIDKTRKTWAAREQELGRHEAAGAGTDGGA